MNELVHVQLHPLALSNMNGYQWCRGAIGSNGGFRETDVAPDLGMSDTVVPVTTLDSLELGRVDLIKMDVAGVAATTHFTAIEALGYEVSIIEPDTGRLVLIGSARTLTESWPDAYRIVDMVAEPQSRDV